MQTGRGKTLTTAIKGFVSIVLVLMIAAGQASANDRYWTGGSGNWSDQFDWNMTGLFVFSVPQAGDDVSLTSSDSTSRTITYDYNYSAPLGSLTIDATGTGTMTLSQDGNALWAVNEYVGFNGTGNFTQSGGTNTVTGSLSLGIGGTNGTYNLTGGTLDVKGSVTGGTGTSTVTIDGGSLTNNWSSINVTNFNVGYSNGSNGTFTMDYKNLTACLAPSERQRNQSCEKSNRPIFQRFHSSSSCFHLSSKLF
jgi:hypothetical protein